MKNYQYDFGRNDQNVANSECLANEAAVSVLLVFGCFLTVG